MLRRSRKGARCTFRLAALLCHGAGGGGGMGPALLDDEWKFGSDDLTLFKLIKGEIPQQTMPAAFGSVLKDDEIWKIIAFCPFFVSGRSEQNRLVAGLSWPLSRGVQKLPAMWRMTSCAYKHCASVV